MTSIDDVERARDGKLQCHAALGFFQQRYPSQQWTKLFWPFVAANLSR
jgi:hypothetical protein